MFKNLIAKFNVGTRLKASSLTVFESINKEQLLLAAISESLDKLIILNQNIDELRAKKLFYNEYNSDISPSDLPTINYLLFNNETLSSVTFVCHQRQTLSTNDDNEDASKYRHKNKQKSVFLLVASSTNLVAYDFTSKLEIYRVTLRTKPESILWLDDDQEERESDYDEENEDSKQTTTDDEVNSPLSTLPTLGTTTDTGKDTTKEHLIVSTSGRKLTLFASTHNSIELSNEMTLSDSLTQKCVQLIRLLLLPKRSSLISYALIGCFEKKIRVHKLLPGSQYFTPTIQETCDLTIDEASQVICLHSFATRLPSTSKQSIDDSPLSLDKQTNFFAFGLANNCIGVYRLEAIAINDNKNHDDNVYSEDSRDKQIVLRHNRIWRLKSREQPKVLLMFDIDNDGYDELIVCYASGKLEARNPFTGQLLATKKCFKYESTNRIDSLPTNLAGAGISRQNSSRPLLVVVALDGQVAIFDRSNDYSTNKTVVKNGNRLILVDIFVSHQQKSYIDDTFIGKQINIDKIVKSQQILTQNNTKKRIDKIYECKQNIKLIYRLAKLSRELQELNSTVNFLNENSNSEMFTNISSNGYANAMINSKNNKASLMYRKQMFSERKISHKWKLNPEQLTLELEISFELKSLYERLNLVKIKDESCNLLSDEFVVSDYTTNNSHAVKNTKNDSDKEYHKVYLTIKPLIAQRNVETILQIEIFIISKENFGSKQENLICPIVIQSSIEVPKYSMFWPGNIFKLSLDKQTNKEELDSIKNLDSSSSDDKSKLMIELSLLKQQNNAAQILYQWISSNVIKIIEPILPEKTNNGQANLNLTLVDVRQLRKCLLDKNVGNVDELQVPSIYMSSTAGRQASRNTLSFKKQSNHGNNDRLILFDLKDEANGKLIESVSFKLSCTNHMLTINFVEPMALNAEFVVELVNNCCIVINETNTNKISSLVAKHHLNRTEMSTDLIQIDCCQVKLELVHKKLKHLQDKIDHFNETETRISSELFECSNHAKSFMEQLAIAFEVNEFDTSRQILSELSIMLNSVQNAARAMRSNAKSRKLIDTEVELLEGQVNLLKVLLV